MRLLLGALLAAHGVIHFMGFAKAFGYASLPQLTQPISRNMGVLWLMAGLLVGATAIMLLTSVRGWWVVGTVALLVSQAAILTVWRDASAGPLGNVLLLFALVRHYLTARG